MGGADVYGSVVSGFSVWAWMWIFVGVLSVVVLAWLIVRSRRSSWKRSDEEVEELERRTAKNLESRPEQVA